MVYGIGRDAHFRRYAYITASKERRSYWFGSERCLLFEIGAYSAAFILLHISMRAMDARIRPFLGWIAPRGRRMGPAGRPIYRPLNGDSAGLMPTLCTARYT